MNEDKLFMETKSEKRLYIFDTLGNVTQILKKRKRKPFNTRQYFISQLSWKNVCLDIGIDYIDFRTTMLEHDWDDEEEDEDDDENGYDYDN